MTAAMIVLAGAMMLGMMFFMHGGHKGCGSDGKTDKAAQQLAGEQAKVTGTVHKRGGVQAIVVSKTEKP